MLNDIKNRHTQDTAEKGIVSLSQAHKDREWLLKMVETQSSAIKECMDIFDFKDKEIETMRISAEKTDQIHHLTIDQQDEEIKTLWDALLLIKNSTGTLSTLEMANEALEKVRKPK